MQSLQGLVQRQVEIAQALFQFVRRQLAGGQAGFPQGHATADVVADQRRIEATDGEERRADRIAAAGMQVRETDDAAHAVQLGGGLQLLDRLAFDPGAVRGDQCDARGQRLDVVAHNPIHVIETVDPGGRPKPSGHSRKGEGRLTEK